ncbi:MAG: M48 family metallopeptidase, partial [Bacteroidota bacterium]
QGIYDAEKYSRSQDYEKTKHRFGLISSSLSFIAMMCMLFFNGFAFADNIARSYSENTIFIALLFFGMIGIASDILSLPFQLYAQFVIEKKFGFNKMTYRTFILDKIKSYFLAVIIGGGLMALIIFVFENTGEYFWLLAWAIVTAFMIFMSMFYSSLIVPLFNKQKPLEEGELKNSINNFAAKAGFKLANIYVIDGSKRSTKANAYFSGLGAKKRIVLFDTLIQNHTTEELVAVLAHEIGHYKKKHTLKGMLMSVVQTGILLYIMGQFIGNPVLSEALGAGQGSFHMGILAFGMLYGPISLILGLLMNAISRRYEYQADRFAAEKYNAKALKDALIKLSVNHLSNLRPHPVYVMFHYSHPPLLRRLKALDEAGTATS